MPESKLYVHVAMKRDALGVRCPLERHAHDDDDDDDDDDEDHDESHSL